MDLCAELTLHVLRFVQSPDDPPVSPAKWHFVPDGVQVAWPEARRLLRDAVKPIIVAPLAEPGMIGTWGVAALTGMARARAEHNLANQVNFLRGFAAEHGLRQDDSILFETAADRLVLSLAELDRWLHDYGIHMGWTLSDQPAGECRARMLVLKHLGGPWSPGMSCRVGPPGQAA